MKPIITVAALLLCQTAVAQTYKCTDAVGRVTYGNRPCSELGLKDAGEVRDRIQITPAFQPPAAPPEPTPARPAAEAKPPAEAPKEPERRCFTVTTASGGKVTRCNDKPDEKAD
jgi:hypothetical protein